MYTKEELISQIKDKTIKRYLRENVTNMKLYNSHRNMILSGFDWDKSKQGGLLWVKIYEHFDDFERGRTAKVKTYEDFKHLDKSIK